MAHSDCPTSEQINLIRNLCQRYPDEPLPNVTLMSRGQLGVYIRNIQERKGLVVCSKRIVSIITTYSDGSIKVEYKSK